MYTCYLEQLCSLPRSRCICNRHDPNYTGHYIQCKSELCEAWQHGSCFGYVVRACYLEVCHALMYGTCSVQPRPNVSKTTFAIAVPRRPRRSYWSATATLWPVSLCHSVLQELLITPPIESLFKAAEEGDLQQVEACLKQTGGVRAVA